MIFYLFNLRKHIGIDTFQGFTFTAFGLNGRSLHLVALEQQVSENASRNKFFARHNLELYILIRECHTQDLRSRKVETYRRSEWRSWCLKAFSPKLRLRAFTQSLECPSRGMKERDLATSHRHFFFSTFARFGGGGGTLALIGFVLKLAVLLKATMGGWGNTFFK